LPEEIFSDEYFMRMAVRLAMQAFDEGEIPIGAVIIAGGRKVIGKGYNQTEKLNDVSAHAEMLALTAASANLGGKYLIDCAIYVTIEPCPMCAAALAWAQIPVVVFGAPDTKKGFSKYQPTLLHPKALVRKGILEKECASLMKDFFKNKR
jgi:tRNA(adenine34) deaminase